VTAPTPPTSSQTTQGPRPLLGASTAGGACGFTSSATGAAAASALPIGSQHGADAKASDNATHATITRAGRGARAIRIRRFCKLNAIAACLIILVAKRIEVYTGHRFKH
jgi:hypothetical protein